MQISQACDACEPKTSLRPSIFSHCHLLFPKRETLIFSFAPPFSSNCSLVGFLSPVASQVFQLIDLTLCISYTLSASVMYRIAPSYFLLLFFLFCYFPIHVWSASSLLYFNNLRYQYSALLLFLTSVFIFYLILGII